MKRSEMIINIAIELMSRLPEWEKQERLNFADEILQCVEMNGMLPPKICTHSERYLDGHTSKYDRTYENKWEPESDEDDEEQSDS